MRTGHSPSALDAYLGSHRTTCGEKTCGLIARKVSAARWRAYAVFRVNAQEKVARLEALLARVKKNAAQPRARRRTDELISTGAFADLRPDMALDKAKSAAEAPKVAP